MEHFYKNVEGYFNYEELYTDIVRNAPNNSHFVEVGVWKGCSAAFMAVEIINSGKTIRFDCIDHWLGSEEHQPGAIFQGIDVGRGTLYETFLKNMEPVKGYYNPIRMNSVDAATMTVGAPLYPKQSLDFVFIDASHDYDSVSQDLINWFPKVKKGGVFAGHDYAYGPVKQAVQDFARNRFEIIEQCHCWRINV